MNRKERSGELVELSIIRINQLHSLCTSLQAPQGFPIFSYTTCSCQAEPKNFTTPQKQQPKTLTKVILYIVLVVIFIRIHALATNK